MNRKIVIAVDFDGTLCINGYPNIGEPNMRLIDALRLMQRAGHILILWTCREDGDLKEAVDWCAKRDLKFDYVNTDDKDCKWEPGRKVVADMYIDDRAHSPNGFCDFFDILRDTDLLNLPEHVVQEPKPMCLDKED